MNLNGLNEHDQHDQLNTDHVNTVMLDIAGVVQWVGS
jgi:hypothetical protein